MILPNNAPVNCSKSNPTSLPVVRCIYEFQVTFSGHFGSALHAESHYLSLCRLVENCLQVDKTFMTRLYGKKFTENLNKFGDLSNYCKNYAKLIATRFAVFTKVAQIYKMHPLLPEVQME